MVDHVADREKILQALREELVGPAPAGEELDCTQPVSFDDARQSYKPWRQKGSGEEILQRDSPTKRYGIGVLYPVGTVAGDNASDAGAAATGFISVEEMNTIDEEVGVAVTLTDKAQKEIEERIEKVPEDTGSDEFDMSSANTYRPSSMGISFLAEFPEQSKLIVEASGGRYQPHYVQVEQRERRWWLRSPVSITVEFDADAICTLRSAKIVPSPFQATNIEGLDLRVEVFSRPRGRNPRHRLVTVCLVNRTPAGTHRDESCLFQSFFKASVASPNGALSILPYPSQRIVKPDEEEQSLALLYRNEETFAVGHGCAANWDKSTEAGWVSWVSAECLPTFEVPSTTPEIFRKDGTPLQVPMAPLAGLVKGDDGFEALSEVIALYEQWISTRRKEVESLDTRYRDAAVRHLYECDRCVQRMKDGLAYLRNHEKARRAFQLANHAILLQQVNTRREARRANYDEKTKRIVFSEDYREPDPSHPQAGRGFWRPFQIAFLLMTIRSAVEPGALDRRTVELIWFPTGGGKTEAYLGLAAFALFMRRLKDHNDIGVHVLMRYTLRLLTTQQFQRASGLACAMEHLRRKYATELGEIPFSIGIWVGAQNTPNRRDEAVRQFHALQKSEYGAKNQFVLGRCPWCGAQMGILERKGKRPKTFPRVLGYEEQAGTVVFRCPDPHCEFRDGMPVYVIDEDIYEQRPSIVIGTVDKFAMLAWRPEARTLFGFNINGERMHSPPGLVVQDELHLISGPLGSMVGLYEPVIEELCTDRRSDQAVAPKIISSTATVRRYAAQIKALYGRNDVALFPPPGLEAGDSFFAHYARKPDGTLEHGRMYAGVHAPGLGSMQTVQVRTFIALLQAPVHLPTMEARDPWWTLLIFFNSLRELGTTLSLFQSDIPDYFRVLMNRAGLDFSQMRRLWALLELTGRIPSDEVPLAISKLEISCTSTSDLQPQDVCLASNILEVGIDIDRLSLMAVVGQPKTTSQYIQVTGRVGRRWQERPGLVVTLYGASKPRDRSHFEKFRSYHERLYAQVEPTSVTPFSPPSLDRALHAVLVSYIRQAGNQELARNPYPYPAGLITYLKGILLKRVQSVDPAEAKNFEQVFDRRADEWKRWERSKWDTSGIDSDIPLLREAGAYADAERKLLSWATPMSMRSVDAECEAQVTTLYIQEGE